MVDKVWSQLLFFAKYSVFLMNHGTLEEMNRLRLKLKKRLFFHEFIILSTFICVLSICVGCSKPLPAHVSKDLNGVPQPDPGYSFIHRESDLAVQWTPGASHPKFAHVFAASVEGHWNIEPGYSWVTSAPTDLRAQWSPRLKYPGQPHVYASDKEGYWNADEGYVFIDATQGLDVKWSPGLKNTEFPHVYAGSTEGEWQADAGYDWDNQESGDFRVHWSPGISDSKNPNIIADSDEGKWKPVSGYRWLTDDPNDLRVTSSENDDNTDAMLNLVKVGLAMVGGGNNNSDDQDGDDADSELQRQRQRYIQHENELQDEASTLRSQGVDDYHEDPSGHMVPDN